jgi:hypothetical protein
MMTQLQIFSEALYYNPDLMEDAYGVRLCVGFLGDGGSANFRGGVRPWGWNEITYTTPSSEIEPSYYQQLGPA